MGLESDDESDNFSDIDDDEVATYLHNDVEQRYKKIIWEKINREYLQIKPRYYGASSSSGKNEQAAKEAEAAAKEAMMANFEKGSAQALDAKKLVEEAAANNAKLKKGRQRKRAAEAKNPEIGAEAAHQMLSKKRISSTPNHDRFKDLFDEPENSKKSRPDPNEEKNGVSWTSKSEAEGENNEEELDTVDEYEEGNGYGDYQEDSYHYDDEEYEAYDDDGLC